MLFLAYLAATALYGGGGLIGVLHVPTVGWTGQQQAALVSHVLAGVIDGYEGRPWSGWSGGGSAPHGKLVVP